MLISFPIAATLLWSPCTLADADPGCTVFAATDPIIQIHDDTLESASIGTPSLGQDVQHTFDSRSSYVDGTPRRPGRLGAAVYANEFGVINGGTLSIPGVDTFSGDSIQDDLDLSLPSSGMPVAIGRSYTAGASNLGGLGVVRDGVQGRNWFQESQPEIVYVPHASDPANDLIILYLGADSASEFRRVVSGGVASATTFRGVNGATGVFELLSGTGGAPDLYVLTDSRAHEWTFFGFDAASGVASGQLWKSESADGISSYFLGHATDPVVAVSSGYSSNGPLVLYDVEGRRFSYSYGTIGGAPRLIDVVVEECSGANWATPGVISLVASVDYEYYDSETGGSDGDLKQVSVTETLPDGSTETTIRAYYRYFTGAFNATSNPGHPGGLKLCLNAEGVRQADLVNGSLDGSFATMSDANLRSFADYEYEYNSAGSVSRVWLNGACGCAGAPSNSITLSYAQNSGHTSGPGYDQGWAARTRADYESGRSEVQYFDEAGQCLSRIVSNGDPSASPQNDYWVTYVSRSAGGFVEEQSSPATVTSYDHATGLIQRGGSLGWAVHYVYSTGATDGFAIEASWSQGVSGLPVLLWQRAFIVEDVARGDSFAQRTLVASESTYPNASEQSAGPAATTSFMTSLRASTLQVKSTTRQDPAASISKNGSGLAIETYREFDAFEREVFSRVDSGPVSYTKYARGLVSLVVVDANTSKSGVGQVFDGVSVPPAFSTSSGLHMVESFEYDALGRLESSVGADGRVTLFRRKRIANGMDIALEIPDYDAVATSFGGPVAVAQVRLDGLVEARGMVGVPASGSTHPLATMIDATQTDFLAAIQFGSVKGMRKFEREGVAVNISEEKVYFDTPTAGWGVSGVNYDRWLYHRDSDGNLVREEAPDGTVTRHAFDARGFPVEQTVGTNDAGLPGSASSGSSNMVKVFEWEYDGAAAGGDGWVTKVREHSSGSIHSDYFFDRDAIGRLRMVTEPDGGKVVYSYDGSGRLLAEGRYSSSSPIDPALHDPLTFSPGRLALTVHEYDERGNEWRKSVYEVDSSTGALGATQVQLRWHDELGRTVHEKGRGQWKHEYDGLGRLVKTSELAADDDATYGDALSAAGDVVVRESHNIFDGLRLTLSFDVLRRHDDKGPGSSTGPLDSGADLNPFAVTPGDLVGVPDIQARYYDAQGRETGRHVVGDNSSQVFNRASYASPPASSPEVAVQLSSYDDFGRLETFERYSGSVTKYEYDDAGRIVKEIANYDVSVNGGSPDGSGTNATAYLLYEDGLLVESGTEGPGGSKQATTYSYGVSSGSALSDSDLDSAGLLASITYPDSSGVGDDVALAYDRQGRVSWVRDQEGNEIQSLYTPGGKLQSIKASTIASGFDQRVKRVEYLYDDMGRLTTASQFGALVGGVPIDQVEVEYNGWGLASVFRQDVDSAIGTTGTVGEYVVEQVYSSNGLQVRLDELVLPSGRSVGISYGAPGSIDDGMSRVSGIDFGGGAIARYEYLGDVELVGLSLPEISVERSQFQGSAYSRRDALGRASRYKWERPAVGVNYFDIESVRDSNGRLVSRDELAPHESMGVVIGRDGLSRVLSVDRGTVTSGAVAVASGGEQFSFGSHGSMSRRSQDLNGDGDYSDAREFDSTQTFSAFNELASVDVDSDSVVDLLPSYNAVGGLVDDGSAYELTWDAFGRLVEIRSRASGDVVEQMKYNALNHLTEHLYDTNLDGVASSADTPVRFAYSPDWRRLASFRGGDSQPKEEWVPHFAGIAGGVALQAIDLFALWEVDQTSGFFSGSDGALETRRYLLQDEFANVVSVVGSSGYRLEDVRYSAYGRPFGFPGGDLDSDGDCDAADVSIIDASIAAASYDVRGDVDSDGQLDAQDRAAVVGFYQGAMLGFGALSGLENHIGWHGSYHLASEGLVLMRNRVFDSRSGLFASRDPLGFEDGFDLYRYGGGRPITRLDPEGTTSLGEEGLGVSTKYIPCNSSLALTGFAFDLDCEPGSNFTIDCSIESNQFWPPQSPGDYGAKETEGKCSEEGNTDGAAGTAHVRCDYQCQLMKYSPFPATAPGYYPSGFKCQHIKMKCTISYLAPGADKQTEQTEWKYGSSFFKKARNVAGAAGTGARVGKHFGLPGVIIGGLGGAVGATGWELTHSKVKKVCCREELENEKQGPSEKTAFDGAVVPSISF